jgi:hypothetical protein
LRANNRGQHAACWRIADLYAATAGIPYPVTSGFQIAPRAVHPRVNLSQGELWTPIQ